MPEDRKPNEEQPEEEKWPAVPPLPNLPDVPVLKTNLPTNHNVIKEEAAEEMQRQGLAYIIPAALIAPIVVLTLLGYWLDGKLDKYPGFTLGGALLGTVVGFINMIRLVNRLNR